MDAALTRAEYLLSNSPVDKPLMVEVVTNDQGLDLLRSDLSPLPNASPIYQIRMLCLLLVPEK